MEATISTAHFFEVNLDGLIGPTHNYSGLSYGNVASLKNFQSVSNPKEAAKQGLEKMRELAAMGVRQLVMPPHDRPLVSFLRSLGYSGSDKEVILKAGHESPELLLASGSSSGMWMANAATISPSADTQDGKIHFTPANLASKLHRSIEPPFTSSILRKIFKNPDFFSHHDPLPAHLDFADEGAANHTRLCSEYGIPGVELFVYGRSAWQKHYPKPGKFPARQTVEASESVARLHLLRPAKTIFAQQNPAAIDAGVFHNDVISVGNQNVFFYHADAFTETEKVIKSIRTAMAESCTSPMHFIRAEREQISLKDAVQTYLFNSQLVTLPSQSMTLIAPIECQESSSVRTYLENLLEDPSHPIKKIVYMDLRQSMQNGGGPACLRLRIEMNEREYAQIHPGVILTQELHDRLLHWIESNYRDRLTLSDLGDPELLSESRATLDKLTEILDLGPIYPFQGG
jgi:succinylarginine dihydrolase